MTQANQGRPDDLMTAADAARILGLSADMVRLLARKGRLIPAVQSVRGLRMFRRADIEALAEERRRAGPGGAAGPSGGDR